MSDAIAEARDRATQLLEAGQRGLLHGPSAVPLVTLARGLAAVCDAVEMQGRELEDLHADVDRAFVRTTALHDCNDGETTCFTFDESGDCLLAAVAGFDNRSRTLSIVQRVLFGLVAERDSLRRECEVKADAIAKLTGELGDARVLLGAAERCVEVLRECNDADFVIGSAKLALDAYDWTAGALATFPTAEPVHQPEHADPGDAPQSSAPVPACEPPHGMHAPATAVPEATGDQQK